MVRKGINFMVSFVNTRKVAANVCGAEGEEDAQRGEVPEQTEGLGPGAPWRVPAKQADFHR